MVAHFLKKRINSDFTKELPTPKDLQHGGTTFEGHKWGQTAVPPYNQHAHAGSASLRPKLRLQLLHVRKRCLQLSRCLNYLNTKETGQIKKLKEFGWGRLSPGSKESRKIIAILFHHPIAGKNGRWAP